MSVVNTTPSRIELPGCGDSPSSGREQGATKLLKSALPWSAVMLIAGFGAWMLLPNNAGRPAATEPVLLSAAAASTPGLLASAARSVPTALAFDPPTAAGEAITPIETAPVDGLSIPSQHWRRGGLGSKALVTFTIRNRNEYAVKDLAISCAFSRRDGSHLTDRVRMIHEIVKMRGRRTFASVHVGFVNVNAFRAKCAPVAARHA
jgi:hypothetical protein